MEFFIPNAEDNEQAEEVWHGAKKFVEDQMGPVKDRRIYKITYKDTDTQKTHKVAIGDNVPRVGEPAIVILESDSEGENSRGFDVFHICTPNRAVLKGIPVMIGKNNVISTVDFD